MKELESWEDDWFEPHTPLERAAPWLALVAALFIAWL
jgi:hypothetical protein